MHPAFAKKLGLVMQTINVNAQKIDSTIFETYGMMVAAFSITDQANRITFFEEPFLMTKVIPDMVLRMLFLTLSDANIDFSKREL